MLPPLRAAGRVIAISTFKRTWHHVLVRTGRAAHTQAPRTREEFEQPLIPFPVCVLELARFQSQPPNPWWEPVQIVVVRSRTPPIPTRMSGR
jgi:hypothetical protein